MEVKYKYTFVLKKLNGRYDAYPSYKFMLQGGTSKRAWRGEYARQVRDELRKIWGEDRTRVEGTLYPWTKNNYWYANEKQGRIYLKDEKALSILILKGIDVKIK